MLYVCLPVTRNGRKGGLTTPTNYQIESTPLSVIIANLNSFATLPTTSRGGGEIIHYSGDNTIRWNSQTTNPTTNPIWSDLSTGSGISWNTQSFTNLLENGDFESWSAGASAAPDGWSLVNGCTVVQESSITKIGQYSAKITATQIYSRLNISISNPTDYNGKEITFGCWLYSSAASAARMIIIDSVSNTSSDYHTGGGTWEWITVTRTIEASSTSLDVSVYPDRGGGSTFAYIDGAILVEGSVCPAFSPKPLVDDGKSLQIDPTTNAVTIGREPTADAEAATKSYVDDHAGWDGNAASDLDMNGYKITEVTEIHTTSSILFKKV